MKTHLKRYVPLAVLLFLAVLLAVASLRPPSPAPPAGTPADLPTSSLDPYKARRLEQPVSHGSGACADCHEDIVADYQRNGMSRTWRAATQLAERAPDVSTSLALPDVPPVLDLVTGYAYHVKAKGESLEQIETRRDSDHRLARTAQYLIGSGAKAVAMIAEENGYLTQLPIAWYRHSHESTSHWGLNPGFELQNHRFGRPITTACIACHGTYAKLESPAANRVHLPVEDGIACERCHGATQGHVAYQSGEHAGQKVASSDNLLSLSIFTAQQKNDLCFQCHLQGDVTLYRAESEPFQFRPGNRLPDHRHDYLIDTGEPTTLGVASHGARMLQSRCYTASAGQLTCVLCHDAHRPTGDFDLPFYDDKCATCHTPQSCKRIAAPRERDSASGCVACHMPQRASQEGIHLVFTDHAILRHKLPPDRVAPPPDVLPHNAAVELISCWPGDKPAAASLGAAYVLLHETMGPQLSALERGRRLLTEAVSGDPHDLESRYWLASAMVAQGHGQEAIPHFREIVAQEAPNHAARFRLAIAQELVGDYAAAISLYEQLVDDVPFWLEPYPRLAQLYLSQRQADRAARVLTQQLSYQENALAFAQLALAERLRGGSHEAALATLENGLRLNPRLPTAYLNRAALFLLAGQHDQAKTDFRRVLALDANNPQATQALQALSREAR